MVTKRFTIFLISAFLWTITLRELNGYGKCWNPHTQPCIADMDIVILGRAAYNILAFPAQAERNKSHSKQKRL